MQQWQTACLVVLVLLLLKSADRALQTLGASAKAVATFRLLILAQLVMWCVSVEADRSNRAFFERALEASETRLLAEMESLFQRERTARAAHLQNLLLKTA